jgi:hypothetical protein
LILTNFYCQTKSSGSTAFGKQNCRTISPTFKTPNLELKLVHFFCQICLPFAKLCATKNSLSSHQSHLINRAKKNCAYVDEIDPSRKKIKIQSNLCITTTLGTKNLWPLLTGGRCSEVALCYEN